MFKVKVNFAPEFFDSFEGTQEELDQIVAEITKQFENLTQEELSHYLHSNELNGDFNFSTPRILH